MDHGNGTKTYFADGQSKNVHKPSDTIIGSPGNLMSPDRYEFYTFDETGDLVKRLMTLEEIHGLIAGADPESVMADASPTYYHDALSSHSSEALMHLPASDLESLDAPAVHKVLESVQNVLKNEMAANSGKPIPSMTSASLHRPDSASAWSALFPGLIETPDDVANLSGYLLPSKTTEPMEKPSTKKPLTSTKMPSTSIQQPMTTIKLPSSSIKTQFSTTTEKVRSTPKYTTVKPESISKFTLIQTTTLKPSTTKKPFRPIQTFDKQKPSLQKPTLNLHTTTKPSVMSDSFEVNKEMSASISDMLSQVTDSQSSNHKPLQTNTLIEKDNTADYVPEESSPELSYYSPMAMTLSTAAALKPVTEALTLAKKPSITASLKSTTTTEIPFSQKTTITTTEIPFSQKTTSTITTTKFGPTKSNVTKPRPFMNVTTASYVTKPSTMNKFNASTTVSTTRNNYQYPPSNMSTKYMQKITQTTQAYPNKLMDSFIKVVNKTINNATLSVKQPIGTFWNTTEEIKNTFVKDPIKVFQNKVTSARPSGINRSNVTLSNRIQELKTTATPNFSFGSSMTPIHSQTEANKFVSVKVEEWPMTTQRQPTVSPSTTQFVSTEKSFSSSNSQPLNAITDANAIRELISSLMTKPTTAFSTSTSTVSPTTTGSIQTLTAAVSTTLPTLLKTVTGIPAAMISSTTEAPVSTTSTITTTTAATTTPETTTATVATTIGTAMVKTAVEAATAPVTTEATTTTAGSTTVTTTTSSTTPVSTTTASTTMASKLTASTLAASTITSSTKPVSTIIPNTTMTNMTPDSMAAASTAANLMVAAVTPSTTASTIIVSSSTIESETQYVPVTHFLPELQVKDKLETENNSSTPGVDTILKDGISAVANMLQNTQKPAVLGTKYQQIGEKPYEKVVLTEEKQSSTEQARKQATVKLDYEETTTMTENSITPELYEFTTVTESTTQIPDVNDTIAMESVTANSTEEISRSSEPGFEMLTVFNVSSTGGPMQVAKLADLSSETQIYFDSTTPFENRITTDSMTTTDEPLSTTFLPMTVTNATTITTNTTIAAATEIQNVTTPIANTTNTAAPTNSTPSTPAVSTTIYPGFKSPGPSLNAYRPLVNSVSPSTVELHPAPHESMGLEASVAYLGDDVRRFADLCNELSFKMWTAVTGKGQIASRSLVLSPFELTAMLAMVFLGARGSTSGQMNDILRLDDMVTFNPHQVLRNITHSITNINNPGVATASFVREIYSHKVNYNIFVIL